MSTASYIPSSFPPFPLGAPHSRSAELPTPFDVPQWEMVGNSAAMQRLRLQLRRIGPHFRTVLIQGDSGTGKQTVAYALHRMSPVVDGPFLTSASGNRIGYLMKLAQHGTLYFDRVDEMPLNAQDEMLEVLCRSEWAQDGLAAPRRIHPRLIISTTQDLRALTASGQFRHELYQRIAMVQIPVPSLAERSEDIPLLAKHFLDKFADPNGDNRMDSGCVGAAENRIPIFIIKVEVGMGVDQRHRSAFRVIHAADL